LSLKPGEASAEHCLKSREENEEQEDREEKGTKKMCYDITE